MTIIFYKWFLGRIDIVTNNKKLGRDRDRSDKRPESGVGSQRAALPSGEEGPEADNARSRLY